MKIPLIDAYFKITKGVEDISTLSLNKQVCIIFLRWGVFAKDKDRVLFIETALRWRKEKNKIGGNRTLLERKMRKLLKAWRRHKAFAGQRKAVGKVFQQFRREKRGVFSEEYRRERMREQNKENMRRQLEAGMHPGAKLWDVYEPDGNVVRVRSLRKYCIENGLQMNSIYATAFFPGKSYKGYRCERVDDLFESL